MAAVEELIFQLLCFLNFLIEKASIQGLQSFLGKWDKLLAVLCYEQDLGTWKFKSEVASKPEGPYVLTVSAVNSKIK